MFLLKWGECTRLSSSHVGPIRDRYELILLCIFEVRFRQTPKCSVHKILCNLLFLYRKAGTSGGRNHPLHVFVKPKDPNFIIDSSKGFYAFKQTNRIMENLCISKNPCVIQKILKERTLAAGCKKKFPNGLIVGFSQPFSNVQSTSSI